MASLPHDRWTFPFRQQKEQNSVYLERWLQCGHWALGRAWIFLWEPRNGCKVGWGAGYGLSSSPQPAGALSAFLLEWICCSERGSQPPAHSGASPKSLPRLPRKECARPSFPPHPRSFCSLGMQRCCAPSRTHQGVPAPTAPLLNENTIGSLLVLLPTAPRADTSQRRVRRERGWMGMGLMPSCHTGSGITFY